MKTYMVTVNREYPIERKVYNARNNAFDIISTVKMTKVYLSILSPKKQDAAIMYDNRRKEAIFYTEDELPYVQYLLKRLSIEHKIEEII
jgi:hypothetical protein